MLVDDLRWKSPTYLFHVASYGRIRADALVQKLLLTVEKSDEID